MKLEGMPRQTSTHACGVVIACDDLTKFMPLARNGDELTTQYSFADIERLGHLKMDFLGLRNLNDIQKCIQYIKQNHNVVVDFDKQNYDDPNVYKLISSGNTKGIFQIESGGFQKFMRELQPTCLEDIVAAVSLYRPGPMDSIPRYVNNKHHPEQTTYAHPILEPILSVTYGCIVYQEQVMRIVQDMAGYTLGQADMVRRMMGKKKLDAMRAERQVFLHGKPAENGKPAIDGAIKRGVPEDVANSIWNEMETFASYAFNKSHAAAYSYITYQTAYLKTYYEPEFLTSLLNNRITNADEIKNYVTYAKEEKIEVLPPDINLSETYFSVKDNKIRFGLAALKNVGIGVVDSIIAERNANGPFTSISDFLSRLDSQAHNKRCLESMILSGAFDCFGVKRSQLMQVFPGLVDKIASDRKRQATGQFSMFDEVLKQDDLKVEYPNIPEYDNQLKLKLEKEVVGVYVTGHPLSNYIDKFSDFTFTSDMIQTDDEEIVNAEEGTVEEAKIDDSGLVDGAEVTCGGLVTEFKKVITKRTNKEMAIVKIEDLYGTIDLMLFPNVYAKFKHACAVDSLVSVKGKLSVRDGEAPVVLVDAINPLMGESKQTTLETTQKPKTLYLKYDVTNQTLHDNIYNVLSNFAGTIPVIIKCEVTGKSYKLNVFVDGSDSLLEELHAFVKDEYIKLL